MSNLLDLYHNNETVRRLAELQEVVQPTLEELAGVLGYGRAFVTLVDPVQQCVQGAVGVNPPEEVPETTAAADGPGPVLRAFLTGRPLRVDDALRDPRVPESERPLYARAGMLAFAAVPLVPASAVLVVSRGDPISEAAVNELLPYAGRIVVTVAERSAAERLRESGDQHAVEKEWLWWMLTAVQDPVVLTDEENEILLHNVHAERLLRARPEDSPGKQYAIQLNNTILSATLSSFRIDQRPGLGREVALVDPIEGAELVFEIICQPATNLRTGERGMIAVLRDVTDLRRADEELRRSLGEAERAGEEARRERDRLNRVLANVADPIIVTDPIGEIILMNQPAERLLQPGGPRSDDRTAAVVIANDAKLIAFVAQLGMESAEVRQGEVQLVDPDTEETLTMSVTATEVRDALGQVTAVVSVLHDLTKIRELERRTVEQQLFESEKLAAVGRMAAAVAHEINNPLEAIKNSLYLLVSHTPADDPNRRFLEIASKETDRVSGIIRQMLGFYRPAVVKAPTDINALLDEAFALLVRQFRQHRVTLRTDLDRSLPPVLASADQLKQVFLNLFLNARDAMPDGGTLHVSTRLPREADAEFLLPGGCVLIQVHDTGTGIAEENLRLIFEPFFSTKREQRGTGLGLWVSQGIVQQHGGQMKVRSRPGRGTTFTVTLPLGGQDD